MGSSRIIRCAAFLMAVSMLVGGRGLTKDGRAPWLFRDLRFRLAAIVETGIYCRKGPLVRCHPDFTALFSNAGAPTANLDVNSIRVAALDDQGRQKEVPYAFLKSEQIEAKAADRGELVWQLPGEVEPLETRKCFIYFDSTETGPRERPNYPLIPGAEQESLNLVRNPGFEEPDPKDASQAAYWIPFAWSEAKGTIEVVREPHHSGERILKTTCTGGRSFGCQQQRIPLKPNALYRVSAWVRSDPNNTTQGLLMLVTAWLYQANGRRVKMSNAKFQESTPLYPGLWTRVATRGLAYQGTDVKTPPDTAYCDLQIGLYSSSRTENNEALGSAYVDDVEIVEVTPDKRIPPMEVEIGAVETAR